MDFDLGAIVVAIITTLGTIAVAAITARRSGVLDRPKLEDQAALRERLDVEAIKAETYKAKLEAEVEDHAGTKRELADALERAIFAERTGDACERRLSELYLELRRSGRLDDRRSTAREGDSGEATT